MSPDELAALASAVADELERRTEAKAAEAFAKSQAAKSQMPKFETGGTTEIALGRLRMSAEAMQPMLDAVPDGLLRQVAQDRTATGPSGMGPPEREGLPPADPNPNQRNNSGWRDATPLSKWRS
jgi:hypothetical protein